MKKWIARAILVGILAALGYWLWTVFFPNPEKLIRARIQEIAKLASFASNCNPSVVGTGSVRYAAVPPFSPMP